MSHPHQVTPEGVALPLEPAGLGTRGAAFAVDALVQVVLIGAALLANAVVGEATAAVVVAGLTTLVVAFGYPIAFEAGRRGQTPGKRLAGLRVQSLDGTPPTLAQATVRATLALVDLWLSMGSVAVISHLVSARGQRLGDLAAGTVVVTEPRRRDLETVRFEVPAGLEDLAARMDVSGLEPTDYRAIRQFLVRAPGLPSATRRDLAGRLATGAARRLGTPVPGGVDPEGYLRAVAAAVQGRSAERAPDPGGTVPPGGAVPPGGTVPPGGAAP